MTNPDLVIPVGERLPPAGTSVLVVTASFRCLATVDPSGVWHHASDGSRVEEEVWGWIEMEPFITHSFTPASTPVRPRS